MNEPLVCITSRCPICTSTQTHYCPEQWRREIEEYGSSTLDPHDVWEAALEYCSQATSDVAFEDVGDECVDRAEYLVGLAQELRGDRRDPLKSTIEKLAGQYDTEREGLQARVADLEQAVVDIRQTVAPFQEGYGEFLAGVVFDMCTKALEGNDE